MKELKYIIFLILVSFLAACIVISSDELRIDETIYLRHEGADMPVYLHGNKTNNTYIIALHGAGSFGLSFRNKLFVENLEENHVMIYFDQRGQSMSEGHYKEPNELINLMASDVEDLIKLVKGYFGDDISLFLMGHSFGGLLSAETLVRPGVQDLLKGWINIDGIFDLPTSSGYRYDLLNEIAVNQIDVNNSVSDWEEIIEQLAALDPMEEESYFPILKEAGKAINLLKQTDLINEEDRSALVFQAVVANNPIHWQWQNFLNRPVNFARETEYSIYDRMHEINIPAHFVYGRYDVSVPPASGMIGFENLSSIHKFFNFYEKSIHHPHDTEPGKFVEQLNGFVEAFK